jgi:hypothetical protein
VKNITTYVGVDAHKKDLFIAMLVGDQPTPVTWQLANEPNAVRLLVRKLERDAPGPVLRIATPGHHTAGELSGHRAGADSPEARRAD